jgi:putative oxidoreductase
MLQRLKAAVGPYAFLPLRLAVGLAGILHGWPKISHPSAFIRTVTDAALPWPQALAWLGMGSLVLGGALVLVGFQTRLAAFAIACTAGVAAFRVQFENGFFGDSGFEGPLLLMLAALPLLLGGPGRASIDGFRGKA